jgi:hypothetical protein
MSAESAKKDPQERRRQVAQVRAEQQRRDKRHKGLIILLASVFSAVVLAGGSYVLASHRDPAPKAASTPPGSPNVLAPVWSGLTGQQTDGVSSNQIEQLAYHIHAHLAIYINGAAKTVPYGVGIVQPWTTVQTANGPFVDSGSAFYYLHTHDGTGIIHIESPTQTVYDLGQFFAEWHQSLSTTRIGAYQGAVTTYLNGAKYAGNPAGIPLKAHDVIQLDLGGNVAPKPFTFPAGL